ILDSLAAQHGLAFEKAERVGDKAVQAEPAEHQRSWACVVHQPAQGPRNSFGSRDTLFDFGALLGIMRLAQFKLEVRKDAEQRVVDFVSRSQSEAGEGGVFLVLGELGLEL